MAVSATGNAPNPITTARNTSSLDIGKRIAFGATGVMCSLCHSPVSARSRLQVEACKLVPIQQHDLTLGVADEAEGAELMEP